ncbi:unnamed protein product, partial [Adineta steineri]
KLQEIRDQYALLRISSKQGPDAHNELRAICEQQRVELEYLRNVMTQQQYSTMTQPVENGVEQLNLNNHENHNIH